MKETDPGGEKWVSVASQRVKVPSARLPNQRRNTVDSRFCLSPSCGVLLRSANGRVKLLSRLFLVESELKRVFFLSGIKRILILGCLFYSIE